MKTLHAFWVGVLCFGIAVARASEVSFTGSLAILQGATDSRSTQVSILVPKNTGYQYLLSDSEGSEAQPPVSISRSERAFSEWAAVRVKFDGLDPARVYRLEVMDSEGRPVDSRELRALDAGRSRARLALVSCMNDRFESEQLRMWPELLSHGPDVVFFLGDNVYADARLKPASPEQVWNRYVETRNRLAVFRAEKLVPSFAIWDDHDFGANDGDSRYAHKEASAITMQAFFPQDAVEGLIEPGPGTSHELRIFRQRFLLLDDRSFRSPNDGSGQQTHWGREQEDWLYSRLKRGVEPTWLMNGGQFFGGYHPYESLEGNHPRAFAAFREEVRKTPAPILFVSGDRHLSEIMEIDPEEIGQRSYELTSSGIHVRSEEGLEDPEDSHPGRDHRNPRMIDGPVTRNSYMIVDAEVLRGEGASPRLHLDIRVYGRRSVSLVRREVQVGR